MTHADITAEVVRLIHQEMPEVEGEITPESRFEDLGMDSLTRVDLLAAVPNVQVTDAPMGEGWAQAIRTLL